MNPLVATLTICVIAIAAVTGIEIFRPTQDNTAVITMIIGFAGSTSVALLALLKAQETHQVVETAKAVSVDTNTMVKTAAVDAAVVRAAIESDAAQN